MLLKVSKVEGKRKRGGRAMAIVGDSILQRFCVWCLRCCLTDTRSKRGMQQVTLGCFQFWNWRKSCCSTAAIS